MVFQVPACALVPNVTSLLKVRTNCLLFSSSDSAYNGQGVPECSCRFERGLKNFGSKQKLLEDSNTFQKLVDNNGRVWTVLEAHGYAIPVHPITHQRLVGVYLSRKLYIGKIFFYIENILRHMLRFYQVNNSRLYCVLGDQVFNSGHMLKRWKTYINRDNCTLYPSMHGSNL